VLKEVLIFENIDSVARNAKPYNLARIQTDGERLIFAEQLRGKISFKESVLRQAKKEK